MVTEKVNPTLTHVSRVAVLLGFGAYFGTLPQHMICVFGTCLWFMTPVPGLILLTQRVNPPREAKDFVVFFSLSMLHESLRALSTYRTKADS